VTERPVDRVGVDVQLLGELRFAQRESLAKAGKQPQLRWRQVDAGARGQALVELPPLLAASEHRQRTLELA
jgi:hypothetical protein